MYTATPLTSSMLSETSYDSDTQTLVIQFAKHGQRGDTWYYSNVPFHIFEGLIAAESAGKFFLAEIKKKYDGRKVEYGAPFTKPYSMAKGSPAIRYFENTSQTEMMEELKGNRRWMPIEIEKEKYNYPLTVQGCVDTSTGEIIAVPATVPPVNVPYPTQLPDENQEKPF